MKRFTFVMDPSITDQEEKDAAFAGVLRAGREAVEPVRAFAAKAESLAWPMRIIKELVSEEEYVDELLLWLSQWDTEYAKFVDPKVQILVSLEDHKNPKIADAVVRFLGDVNEPARFHAVTTLLAQDEPRMVTPLLRVLDEEESVRVRIRVADGLAARGSIIQRATAMPRASACHGATRSMVRVGFESPKGARRRSLTSEPTLRAHPHEHLPALDDRLAG